MKPWEDLDEAEIPNGGVMTLKRHDDEYVIFAERLELMSSKRHGSEESLATESLKLTPGKRILIGGLGLGYTLRAALDASTPDAEIVVAELVPKVVEWNRGVLGHLAGHPLNDPRVEVRVTDVAIPLRELSAWDAILLDVDNGPNAFTQNRNNKLYETDGLFGIRLALRPGGVFTVWSSDPNRDFERLLEQSGFYGRTLAVPAYPNSRKMHYLFVSKLAELDGSRRDKIAHRAAQRAGGGGKPKDKRRR